MNINTKTWHFRIFNIFEQSSARYYNDYKPITDCKYVTMTIVNLLVLLVVASIAIPIGIFILGMMLEPILVFGNYFLGNGIEPVLGAMYMWSDKDGVPSLGPHYVGCVAWIFVAVVLAIILFKKSRDEYEDFWSAVDETTHSSFVGVLYERFKGWKNKHCHAVEFVDPE